MTSTLVDPVFSSTGVKKQQSPSVGPSVRFEKSMKTREGVGLWNSEILLHFPRSYLWLTLERYFLTDVCVIACQNISFAVSCCLLPVTCEMMVSYFKPFIWICACLGEGLGKRACMYRNSCITHMRQQLPPCRNVSLVLWWLLHLVITTETQTCTYHHSYSAQPV